MDTLRDFVAALDAYLGRVEHLERRVEQMDRRLEALLNAVPPELVRPER